MIGMRAAVVALVDALAVDAVDVSGGGSCNQCVASECDGGWLWCL